MAHTNICGPMWTEVIDDKPKWMEVRFLKYKSYALQAMEDFTAFMENQKSKAVKCLQSDNGGKYPGDEFDAFLKN